MKGSVFVFLLGLILIGKAWAAFSLSPLIFYEDVENAEIEIVRDSNLEEPLTFTLVTSSYTATPGEDYEHIAEIFTMGSFTATLTTEITLLDDVVDFGNETFIITLYTGDSDPPFSVTLTILDTGKTCGGDLTDASGVIISPNYPNNYYNDLECVWRITKQPGRRIAVTVHHFDLEWDCYDTLTFRSGDSGDSPLLGDYCGHDYLQNPIVSTGNKMYIIFLTDYSIKYTGFRLTYTDPLIPLTFDESVNMYESSTREHAFTVTVVRSDNSINPFDITIASANGTATSGEDYTAISKTISVADGESSFTFDISLLDDYDDEGDENFTVTLTSDNIEGSPLMITVTIVEDDLAIDFNCNRGTSQGCHNGGTCILDGICDCPAAYIVTDIPDCSVAKAEAGASGCDSRCGDGGLCFVHDTGAFCACKPGRTGHRCTKEAYYTECQQDGIYVCITPFSADTFSGKMYADQFPSCLLTQGPLLGQADKCDGYARKFKYNVDDCGMVGPVTADNNDISYSLGIIVQYSMNSQLRITDELVPITCTFNNDGTLLHSSNNIKVLQVRDDLLGKRVRGGDFSPARLSLSTAGSEIVTSIFFGDIILTCVTVEDTDFEAIIIKKLLLNNTKSGEDAQSKVLYLDGCKLGENLLGLPYWENGNKHTMCMTFSSDVFPEDDPPRQLGVGMTVVVSSDAASTTLLECSDRKKRASQQSKEVTLSSVVSMQWIPVTQFATGNTDASNNWLMPIIIASCVALTLTIALAVGVFCYRSNHRKSQKLMNPPGTTLATPSHY